MAVPVAAKVAVTVARNSDWKKLAGVCVVIAMVPLVTVAAVVVLLFAAAAAVIPGAEASAATGATVPAGAAGYSYHSCAPECPGVDGPFAADPKRAISLALSEVGTSRPTGFNAPGECIGSVRRWLKAAGVQMGYGGPVTDYADAVLVRDGSLRPGDVVQYTNVRYPNSWIAGVHTYMVAKVHPDGTHDIVESNNPGGSGLVGLRTHQRLNQAPPGFKVNVWRFFK